MNFIPIERATVSHVPDPVSAADRVVSDRLIGALCACIVALTIALTLLVAALAARLVSESDRRPVIHNTQQREHLTHAQRRT